MPPGGNYPYLSPLWTAAYRPSVFQRGLRRRAEKENLKDNSWMDALTPPTLTRPTAVAMTRLNTLGTVQWDGEGDDGSGGGGGDAAPFQ